LGESLPREADGLAGEASADEVDGFEVIRIDLLDIAIAGNVGPMLGEHLPAVRLVLHLPAHGHSGTL